MSAEQNRPRPSNLVELIDEMMSHIHRRSADDALAVMNQAGITMAQMVALHLLNKLGALSVSAIAACIKLSAPATSHLVDRLVAANLVQRSEDPIDRRHKSVAITREGRELLQRTHERRTREFSRILARLSSEAQAQFARALARVVEELEALPDREEVREIVVRELKKREAQKKRKPEVA
jgi:DNA-binding MarR family transcriptional regulator